MNEKPRGVRDGLGHRGVPEVRAILSSHRQLWRVDVEGIGTVFCYGLRCGVVHVTDYITGGFDLYVPATSSLTIEDTLDALRRWDGPESP